MTERDLAYIRSVYYSLDDYCEWMDFWEFVDRYGEVVLRNRQVKTDG